VTPAPAGLRMRAALVRFAPAELALVARQFAEWQASGKVKASRSHGIILLGGVWDRLERGELSITGIPQGKTAAEAPPLHFVRGVFRDGSYDIDQDWIELGGVRYNAIEIFEVGATPTAPAPIGQSVAEQHGQAPDGGGAVEEAFIAPPAPIARSAVEDDLPAPPPAPMRQRYSDQAAREWFGRRVGRWPPDAAAPTEKDDLLAAKGEFDSVPRDKFRAIRREIVPGSWRKPGPRKLR